MYYDETKIHKTASPYSCSWQIPANYDGKNGWADASSAGEAALSGACTWLAANAVRNHEEIKRLLEHLVENGRHAGGGAQVTMNLEPLSGDDKTFLKVQITDNGNGFTLPVKESFKSGATGEFWRSNGIGGFGLDIVLQDVHSIIVDTKRSHALLGTKVHCTDGRQETLGAGERIEFDKNFPEGRHDFDFRFEQGTTIEALIEVK